MSAVVEFDTTKYTPIEALGELLVSKATSIVLQSPDNHMRVRLNGVLQEEASEALAVHLIQTARQRRYDEIGRWRDEQMVSGFSWRGHLVETKDSWAVNSMVSLGIMMMPPANGYWTMSDNTKVPVTGEDMRDMALAYHAFVSSLHVRQGQLKEQLMSMTQVSDVEALPIAW